MMNRIAAWRGGISRPALLGLASVVAVAGLVVLLMQPWAGRRLGGDELVVYCAAGLMRPMEEISRDYQREHGVRIHLEPDGSGKLLAKMRVTPGRGDLYLAAEESYMVTARSLGLVAESIPVASQHVVIAVAPGNPKGILGVADLLRPEVRVALPNPELAAVGRSAQRALSATGQWEAIEGQLRAGNKVSLAGTVNEAAQALRLGAADAAVVWDAIARQFDLPVIEVPEFQKSTRDTVVVGVVAGAVNPARALHFARYISGAGRGQDVFQRHFLTPVADADVWEDRPELRLMAGAMLKPAVEEAIRRFEQREGVRVTTIYNGCGIHVAQMRAMKAGTAGADAAFPDAYFACDTSFLDMVQEWFDAGLTVSRNDMVLIVRKGNPKGVTSLADLARGELQVGLAHSVNSAIGAMTDDLLRTLKLHDQVYAADRAKPVVHADAAHLLVNQARVGALDAAVVYRSNVVSHADNLKDLDVIDMNLPQAIARQPYAVGRDSRHRYLMRRLLDAVLAAPSRQRFDELGFVWLAPGATGATATTGTTGTSGTPGTTTTEPVK